LDTDNLWALKKPVHRPATPGNFNRSFVEMKDTESVSSRRKVANLSIP